MKQHKISSGLKGLDTILEGGYPEFCPTLLKGGPGSGKTVFCLCFAHDKLKAGESAVIVTCDESPERLAFHMDNFAMNGSGFLQSGKLKFLDFRPNLNEMVVGDYDLSPILLRISTAIEQTGSQVLVIDSLQNLLMGLGVSEPGLEVLELFDWLRDKKVTTLITASDPQDIKKRAVLEEYAVDCVLEMNQKVTDHLMTRYLRVVKMRGSSHGTNDYPFSLTGEGVSLMPITSTRLDININTNRLSTGLKELDAMIGGKGYFEGTSLLFSARSGNGKSIFANTLAVAAVAQEKKTLYISFEESPSDMIRNMLSVGLDLQSPLHSGKLMLDSRRAVQMGLEEHLISIINLVEKNNIDVLVLDPISSLIDMGTTLQVKMLMIRFLSHIKAQGVTLIFTELLPDSSEDYSSLAISSLVDTWFRLRQTENNGELNRLLHLVKSRGSATSNQIKEFFITNNGIHIEEPYIGNGEIVFGTAKAERMARDKEQLARKKIQIKELQQQIDSLSQNHQVQINSLNADIEQQKTKLQNSIDTLNLELEQNGVIKSMLSEKRG